MNNFLVQKKWKRQLLLAAAFVFGFVKMNAQFSNQAHLLIDTLTSQEFNGRGYSDGADKKTADFISSHFKSYGLKSFNENFYQPFHFDVNTFPGIVSLSLNNSVLKPGVDFIIQAYSSTTDGNFEVVHMIGKKTSKVSYLKKILGNDLHNKVLVWDKEDFDPKNYSLWINTLQQIKGWGASGAVEFTTAKLTMDMSMEADGFAFYTVNNGTKSSDVNEVTIHLENKLMSNYESQNVIGFIPGTIHSDSFIVFSAHYDHLGQLGNGTYFPGANDNASGISMLLTLAHYFSLHPQPYSICFMAFSGEEMGLVGSQYFTEHPLFPLSQIKFLTNMDIVGTGDEGIKVVNGAVLTSPFNALVEINDSLQLLKSVQPRGKAANSDHYFFFEKGVPSFFIYTLGGIAAYHDVFDKSETLPLTEFDDLTKLLIAFTQSLED